MATTAPNYLCTGTPESPGCGAIAAGVVTERDASGKVTAWTVPTGWDLLSPPKPPREGAKARCAGCR